MLSFRVVLLLKQHKLIMERPYLCTAQMSPSEGGIHFPTSWVLTAEGSQIPLLLVVPLKGIASVRSCLFTGIYLSSMTADARKHKSGPLVSAEHNSESQFISRRPLQMHGNSTAPYVQSPLLPQTGYS